jgi:ubiquinone/menaquinone biosynthesis C-methylase UbiE
MTTPYDSYDYPAYWESREYEDRAEKICLKRMISLIPQTQRIKIIDIGAGFGRQTPVYAPLFKECVLLDPSKKLLSEAKSRLEGYNNLKYVQGRTESLPFKQAQFEAALLIRVIHHLSEPQKAFEEVLRVLKPQGYFILEFANKIHFRAMLRAWLRGNFGFSQDLRPEEQRTPASVKAKKIRFLNHHPKQIEKDLNQAGFKIIKKYSVSNFRSPLIKKVVPLNLLLKLEAISHRPLAIYHFGPSIFLLCQKD